ncbi:MAG: prohibitin family protein [Bacteroidota bacterium]
MFLIVLGLIVFTVGFIAGRSDSAISGFKSLLKIAGLGLIIIGIFTSMFRQIEAGHVGVPVMFGQVQQGVLYEGMNFVNPLVDVKEMSTQTQNYTMSGVNDEGSKIGDDAIRVQSADGLEVVVDLTVLYRVESRKAPQIYRTIGVDFQEKVVRPYARARVRESAVYYSAIELYSVKRKEFENNIREAINADFTKRGLILEQLLVRNITLPTSVKESIERKITAVQDAQRMEYVLDKGRREAELKRVEAQGIADAQKIMSEGLSDRVLQYEQIKVQRELANSPNAKIILLGNGKSSPPFIIGQ